MGSSILDPVKDITDNQYIADMKTLNNVLFEASMSPITYENFEITDYIDTNYFYVENERDITVSQGSISFDKDNQKFTWKMDNLKSGLKAKMAIKAKLKDELIGEGGFYSTNVKEEIKSKIGEDEEDITSSKTPILNDKYKVIYDDNAPDGYRVDGVPAEKQHSVFDTVAISDSVPKCEGYQFKGWKITTDNVKKVNGDYFIMPEEDVIIKAIWSKLDITKSMEGTVKEKITLYKQVQLDYENNNHAKKYTGPTDTFNGNQNVYYYNGETPNNNVLFGGFCWRMYRTTDTGGVKMVYNGEPDSNGKCGTDRGNHVGFGRETIQTLSSNYTYGSDYIYDTASKTFTLSGDIEQAIWNSTTYSSLVGKYTCKNTTGDCSTLYYVGSYYSDTSANMFPLNYNTVYSSIGRSPFNVNDSSPADVGYMYNKRYTSASKDMARSINFLDSSSLSTSYFYADSVEFGKNSTNNYYLVEPYKVTDTSEYTNLVGKYTFRSSSETYSSGYVYYIVAVNGSTMYYISLTPSAQSVEAANTSYYFSDSLVEDDSGKLILDLSTLKEVKKSEWHNSYADYNNKYYCQTLDCNKIYFTVLTSDTTITYLDTENDYMYGNTFTYDEDTGMYTLSGETQHFWNIWDNYKKLGNTHYTCWNASGKCQELYYIYHISYSTVYNGYSPRCIKLTNGTSVEKALDEMLYGDDVNTINSTVKSIIDAWYSKNMVQYTEYLEDTIWCNDRSMYNQGRNGWNPNGGDNGVDLSFGGAGAGSLSCPYKGDRFTVNEKNGNGALVYPAGMVTEREVSLASTNGSPLSSGCRNWSLSPSDFSVYGADVTEFGSSGGFSMCANCTVESPNDIRPSISLRPGIEYISGNGTVDNPYVIDMDVDDTKYSIDIEKSDDFYILFNSAYKDQVVVLKSRSDDTRVRSFKLNGKLVNGNSFIMPNENVTITDVEMGSVYFNINIEGDSDKITSKNSAKEKEIVSLDTISENFVIKSFKMNGILINGDTFDMPGEDVVITDVVVVVTPIESEHNPYPNSLNNKVYGEKTFEGATSLTVELDYQTESTLYDWIYLYDSTGKQYGKYGGKTRKTETITIPGDYVKITFRTDGSGNNYYGFKAIITPNYD